jgi:hypothetical protein
LSFLLATQKKSDDMSMMQRTNSAGSEGGGEMRTGSLDSATGAGMMTKRMSNKSDDKWPSFDTADIHKVWKTMCLTIKAVTPQSRGLLGVARANTAVGVSPEFSYYYYYTIRLI